MPDIYTRNGKQILRNGEHFGDAVSEQSAEALLATLSRGQEWTDEDITDLLEQAMNASDDHGNDDYARACLVALKREGLLA